MKVLLPLIMSFFLAIRAVANPPAATVTPEPKEQVEAAKKSSSKLRKKLKMNDDFFTQLESDQNLTTGELTQAAKAEHDAIVSCLNNDQLRWKEKHRLKQYFKIIDRLWDKQTYLGLENPRYSVIETSSQIGATEYDVDVTHDADKPDLIYLKNFYNIGFNFQLSVTQEGDKLTIKKQTYNSSEVSGSGYINSSGSFVLDVEVNDGSTIDKCHMNFTSR